MTGAGAVPDGSLGVVDTSVLFAMGGPENET